MKKRYFFTLFAGLLSVGAMAQTEYKVLEDLTSKIQNADFKADAPVTETITTYDYNHTDVELGGTCMFGQQTVTGWTANYPSDNIKQLSSSNDPAREDGANACAAGVFAYVDDNVAPGLGGDYFPFFSDAGDAQALGYVSVWGHVLKYSQTVNLPAGDYLLIGKFNNKAGDGELSNNFFGFQIDEETAKMSARKTFPVDEWTLDTVFVRIGIGTDVDIVVGCQFGAGSASAPHIFLDNVKLLKVDPSTYNQIQVDEAKAELLALIERGKRLHVDTSAAEAVYNNASATLAQVEAAIAAQKELNEGAITDLSPFFLTNAHFSEDEPVEGGICTYDYDCPKNNIADTNYSMLPVKGWTPNSTENGRAAGVYAIGSQAFLGGTAFLPPTTMSDGATTGKVLGFVTCWTASTQYTQHVTLPAGDYTLEISYYNSGGAQAVAKNLIGFIADDGTEYLGETTTFPVGQWGKETIVFTLDDETEGRFSLGYTSTNVGSGNMPHFFLDGISLLYEGELQFDPSLFALQGVVNSASDYLDEMFNAALYSQLETAIDEAQALVSSKSSDSEANKAAQEKITALVSEVEASIAAYKRLEEFYNKDLNNAQKKYSYISTLTDLMDDVEDAIADGTWDNARIEEVISSLPGIIKEAVQQRFDAALASGETLSEPLDISPLFDTLGYTYSTSTAQGSAVPDKQWSYGNASNFKTQYGTAEVWSQSPFTVSQTLTDLPAGNYTITTKAFYRVADNDTNYGSYTGGEEMAPAYLFAGHVKTPIANVAELAATEEGSFNTLLESYGVYVPNSQQEAYNVFENDEYTDVVTRSATTALAAQGDLTFGITVDDELQTNSWVIWYTFEIAYNALSADALASELDALIEDARLASASYEAERVVATSTALENAIGDGETAADNVNVAEMTEAIAKLNEALAMYNRSKELINEFDAAVSPYLEKIDVLPTSGNTELLTIVDMSEEQYESNAQIEDLIKRLPQAYFNYVIGRTDFDEGALDNPIDISGVILNNDFAAGNANYWTIAADESSEDGKIGQNQGYQGASYENVDEGIVVSQFIEAWRKTAATDETPVTLSNGTISQTLLGVLPQGYYRLEMDGYATHQQAIPAEGIQGVDLYAASGSTVVASTPVGIDAITGTPRHFSCDFYSNGTSLTTVGLLVHDTNANWVAADNFQLSYIGQQQPTGVEGVETATAKVSVYNVAGLRIAQPQKGLNIVVRDGKAQKVLVK